MAEERMLNDEILLGLIKANSGGGGGGTTDYDDLSNKPQIGGVTLSGNKSASDLGLATTTDLAGKQDALTAGSNINMTGNVVKAGVVEVVEPDMTVYGNSTESGSKTYTIETTGVYEIFYCLSLQSTVSVTLPNDANVLFENDLTVSSHPVKHIVVELHEGDTVTIAQTPSQWSAVVSGVLKLDAISVVDVAHTGSIADSTITYTLPNDNKYYLVVGACVGKPTGNNAVDSTSGGTPEITRTLTGTGVRFRSVVVKGSDSPSFSFYGYDGGVASIIAYEIEFEEGNWDYNLATKNYVDTAIGAAVASAYHHAGTKTCAELVAGLLVAGNEGNVYNMTDSGTTTADFIEGAGQPIKAGDNVGIAKISDGVYKFDLLSGFVDTTNFVQKSVTAGLLKNDGTVDTTIQGDVSTLKSGFTTLDNEVNGDSTTYPYADVITIEDAVPANVADCTVKIEPVQDLHGYDKPWVGGAGKNKLPMTVAGIKAANTEGTWNGNAYTNRGLTFTLLSDVDGNVTGININNTATSNCWLTVAASSNFKAGNYKLNGVPSGVTAGMSLRAVNIDASAVVGTAYQGDDVNVELSENTNLYFDLQIPNGSAFDNNTILPMIRLATETDATFAPYTNICPIIGHTEASVQTGGGKNLLNVNAPDVIVGKTVLSDGTLIEAEHVNVSGYIYVKDSAVLTYTSKTYGVYAFNRRIVCYDENKQYLGTCVQTTDTPTGIVTITGTVLANTKYVRVPFARDDASAEQLEYGTQATPYIPYHSQTYTIALGDTIYGGTIRIDSNGNTVMDVDRADVDMSTLTWTATTLDRWYTSDITDIKAVSALSQVVDAISDSFVAYSSDALYNDTSLFGMALHTNGNFFVRNGSTSDTPTGHICYKLATPTTIQLTPQQIPLLKGQNTLTASTGDISVTVNGVSGAIGQVQEQVNATDEALAELADKLPTAPTTDGAYVLTVTVADGTPTYSWESAT